MTKADYDKYDYLIGMDEWNIRNIKRITGGDPEGKIFKMMSLQEAAEMWQIHGIPEILRLHGKI